ncbi:MAG: S-layer homology domain-containing protein [Paenisporosarcina sp.]
MKKLFSRCLVMMVLLGSLANTASAESSRQSVFGDLSLSSSFYEPMYSMYLKDVYEGEHTNDALLIYPQKNVTRGDAAYMLYHLLGLTYVDGKDFNDVPKSSEYYDAIETIAALRVIDGFTDGTFRPRDSLTRGQMSKIIAKAFEYQINANALIPYTDVTAAFKPYVHALSAQGITKGISATKFVPNRFITRQEMAAFMHRAYKKVPGSAYNELEVMNAVNESTRKVRILAIQGLEAHFPNQQPNDLKLDMAALTVEPFLTQTLTSYTNSCYNCDGASVQEEFNFELPYTIKDVSNTSIIMDVVVPTNGINSGYRGVIELTRVGDVWKIKSLLKRSFENAPLKMTIDEATDYLTFALPKYWNQKVNTIKHTGKHPVTGDPLFLVNGNTTYFFDLDTGYLDRFN